MESSCRPYRLFAAFLCLKDSYYLDSHTKAFLSRPFLQTLPIITTWGHMSEKAMHFSSRCLYILFGFFFAVFLIDFVLTGLVACETCSAAAFFVVTTLRNLARDGRTIIASIHQPSSEVFELFDTLTLLTGGKLVYFGEASLANEVGH